MSQLVLHEPNLPWMEGAEDRFFRRASIIFAIVALLVGILFNLIQVPEIRQQPLQEVSPRLAQLILEKKTPPPQPELKKVIKKEPPKPKPEKKPEEKKPEPKPAEKPKPAPKPVDKRAAAKKVAEQSGLIALQDDLADLRDSFDFSDIGSIETIKTGKQQQTLVADTSKVLEAKAGQGSSGISSAKVATAGTTQLAKHQTSTVKSTVTSEQKLATQAKKTASRSATRSQEEIERVFQKNKGAIFSLYNRELRKDPSLQGKVVLELTIAANGSVTACRIVSSELNLAKLEKRLVSKVKQFRFASKNVPEITVTYPIEFLPS